MFELYPYQEKALMKLADGKILWGNVGSGKSLVSLVYYTKRHSPKPLYIITTAKKRDSLEWEGDATKLGIGKEKDATVHGVMTVDSWNNISKYVEVSNAFFIFDEQRLVGNGSWVKSFLKIAKQNSWVLLSGTPGDTWLDYIPIFIANGFYRNRTEFKLEHVVYSSYSKFPKVERYNGVGRLLRHRKDVLVPMVAPKPAMRQIEYIDVDVDLEKFNRVYKDRWHIFEDRPIRDAGEWFLIMRRVSNMAESRLRAVRELMETHPRIIIFYNFDFELEILRKLGSEIDIAEWNGHKHQEIPNKSRWIYLIQYQAGAEGWNCTGTNAMIFYSLTYSYRLLEQAMGRIDRVNTPFKTLKYYILRAPCKIDLVIAEKIKAKKSFSERDFEKFS